MNLWTSRKFPLASGIEGSYRTHSPCIPIMPLKITSCSQVLPISLFLEPLGELFYPSPLGPPHPYVSYPAGPQFEGFLRMKCAPLNLIDISPHFVIILP